MIEESLSGNLLNRYLFEFNFHHDYSNYSALFLRPFFKLDKSWYLLSIIDRHFPDLDSIKVFKDEELLRLIKQATMAADISFNSGRRSHHRMGWNEDKLNPMYYRTAEESKEVLEAYIECFCSDYLKNEINNTLPCNVSFDKQTSTIVFTLPFTNYSPAIHINTVLHNWDTVDDFIKDVAFSLKKQIPSKNKNYFS